MKGLHILMSCQLNTNSCSHEYVAHPNVGNFSETLHTIKILIEKLYTENKTFQIH